MTPAKSMEIVSLSLDVLKNKNEQKRFTSCVNTWTEPCLKLGHNLIY